MCTCKACCPPAPTCTPRSCPCSPSPCHSPEDVFAVHPSGEAHTAAAALPPAWLGAPRWRFLQRTAHVLRHAASSRQAAAAATGDGQAGQHAALRECLSLHLAALQLLEHALEGHAAAAAAAAAAEVQPSPAGSAEDAESGAAADLAAAEAKLQADAAASMEAVEEAAAALDKAGQEPSPTAVTPAAAAVAAAEAALPDPWELLYGAALAWGREAAVDELLGNQARSCRLYARAGTALRCSGGAGRCVEMMPCSASALCAAWSASPCLRWQPCCPREASQPATCRPLYITSPPPLPACVPHSAASCAVRRQGLIWSHRLSWRQQTAPACRSTQQPQQLAGQPVQPLPPRQTVGRAPLLTPRAAWCNYTGL